MKRRDFVSLMGFTAAAWPFAAHAQQGDRSWRIGFLGAASASKYAKLVGALVDGLRDYGYIEGKNLTIEFRWAEGNNQRLPQLAAELAGLNLDCLVTHGTPGTSAAKQTSATLPIVMAVSGDAVATGLIKSLAHPGDNVTGTTFFGPELAAKRLELLREALPNTRRVAVIVNPANPIDGPVLLAMEKTASSFDMKLQQFIVRKSSELESVFAHITPAQFDAVAVFEDAITVANARAIAQLAVKQRLPLTGFAELAKADGLIGYGANIPALFRRAAYFVNEILHGGRPRNIPVEQPTKFDLVVNLRTAKSLGLSIPPTLLATADEVIE
jgi:putative ABC transport system substrate-binding protein